MMESFPLRQPGSASRSESGHDVCRVLLLTAPLAPASGGLPTVGTPEGKDDSVQAILGAMQNLLRTPDGVVLGSHRFKERATNLKNRILIDIDGFVLGLSGQYYRLFQVLLHGRLRAISEPGRTPLVSKTVLLQAAGLLGWQTQLAGLDQHMRDVNLPGALRGPLRQLRKQIEPFGLYVCPIGISSGRAGAYLLLLQEEFQFAPDAPEPCEIDDLALVTSPTLSPTGPLAPA